MMPVAKKHNHTCPICGALWLRGCRSWQGCGGETGPSTGPCWDCQKKEPCHVTRIRLDRETRPSERRALCGNRRGATVYATVEESIAEVRSRLARLAKRGRVGHALCATCASIQEGGEVR